LLDEAKKVRSLVLEPLDVGVSSPSGDDALAPTLTTLKSVDALGGWESACNTLILLKTWLY
jgi:hypothetical protein